MDSIEYINALGRNRLAFGAIDYELAFMGMAVVPDYHRRIDAPDHPQEIPTSKKYVEHVIEACKTRGLEAGLIAELEALNVLWKPLCSARNNLAHAWGYGDFETGMNQLGGVMHDFDASPVTHTPKKWSISDIEQMTADCKAAFPIARALRIKVQSASSP